MKKKKRKTTDRRTAHQRGNRNTIVEDTRVLMASNFRGSDMAAACLYWARATCHRLEAGGQPAILQAGTAYWTRLPPELDDGVAPTQYGYEWEDNNPENVARMMAGEMPEMHVWVGLPDKNQLIDLTTGFQVERCQELLGLNWPAERPADWLWMDAGEVHKTGAYYKPSESATRLAYDLLKISPWGE